MSSDDFGFRYPSVDASRCVGCGACDRACPALTARPAAEPRRVLWAYSRDERERDRSSSGGVFGLLAEGVLSRGGVVYGAAFSDDLRAVRHVRVDAPAGLDAVMRSKYVQSSVGADVYRGVAADLRAGREALFCGTACQVAGLRGYLAGRRVPVVDLLAVDVICHGVPSPRLWSEWVTYREGLAGAPASRVNFRSKTAGWLSYSVAYEYATEKDDAPRVESGRFSDDWYMQAFLSNASLRESCLACPSKRSCGSDITLGDFWGIQSCLPGVYEASGDHGASAVLVNTEAGERAIESISGSLVSGPAAYADVLAGNPSLEHPADPYPRRGDFLRDFADGMPMPELVSKWAFEPSFPRRALGRAKRIVKRLLGR